jgi:hypothetical protein
MTHLKIHSITKWVGKLKNDKVLSIICGFDPDDVPGVGTFYDFLNRFWLSNNEPGKIMLPHKKPKKPSNQAEKLPPKHPNVVKNKPSLTLQLDGVGIVTIKDTSSVILSTLLALITAVMTYPYTLCYLRLIDTIASVL